MQRLAPRILFLFLFLGILLAGCTAPSDEPGSDRRDAVYTHRWAYGPGYGGSDRLPVFEDTFAVTGPGAFTVAID